MIPVFALVGRPNVGKSTLFNRLTKTRDALVANYPGLTRDRKYGEGSMLGKRFMLIDTGGITGTEEGIDSIMAEQSMLAIQEADAVMLIVDSKVGLTPLDSHLAEYLREKECVVYLVANKIDGVNPDIASAEFFELGLKNIYPTTATHGRGVKNLMESVLESFPESNQKDEDVRQEKGIKIAIVGRPNVGKSTLVNRILGEDRVIVFDEPGTTRDSVYIEYQREDTKYTLIDTAGIRKRKNVSLTVEKFSIVKTLQSIDDANVVVFLIDAQEGLVDQDMHLMGTIVDAGRALVIAINKWDGLNDYSKDRVKVQLDRRLHFVKFADLHYISALHGTGVGNLYKSIESSYASAIDKLSTNKLTLILQDAVIHHQPPLVRGRRIKLRYAHAGGKNPPIIVIHGNQLDEIPSHYSRYLEKTFCRALDLHGTPVKIEYRSSENPYEGKKNKLTNRQISKKRRLMKYVKKKK
ncbi:MAG: ribosome biogenesis GTPase Der [Gammaproteobacteria bacterium]|jgi:GTP-binding protein|nr:ribosome biogenesis GTPase Der [Gammaproteobacteria bacterium]MDA7737769.1 ribosome biogenesis GTPase Der [Porticoccus sp.]MDC0412327.1 ribosome biogenesis GTPase Der [Porticoccus sp.]MDC0887820.1 ribosome biogenesis GTPase Der [Porticoccus sp.]